MICSGAASSLGHEAFFRTRNARAAAVLAATAVAGSAGTQAAPLDNVIVGAVYSASDAPYLIADRKGFFRDEGIAVTFSASIRAAIIIAPLGAGQIDVGGGAPAAGITTPSRRASR